MSDKEYLRELDYGITMAVKGMITAMGMQAANNQHPQDQPYTDKDFQKVIEENGLHHNAVLERWLRL